MWNLSSPSSESIEIIMGCRSLFSACLVFIVVETWSLGCLCRCSCCSCLIVCCLSVLHQPAEDVGSVFLGCKSRDLTSFLIEFPKTLFMCLVHDGQDMSDGFGDNSGHRELGCGCVALVTCSWNSSTCRPSSGFRSSTLPCLKVSQLSYGWTAHCYFDWSKFLIF